MRLFRSKIRYFDIFWKVEGDSWSSGHVSSFPMRLLEGFESAPFLVRLKALRVAWVSSRKRGPCLSYFLSGGGFEWHPCNKSRPNIEREGTEETADQIRLWGANFCRVDSILWMACLLTSYAEIHLGNSNHVCKYCEDHRWGMVSTSRSSKNSIKHF